MGRLESVRSACRDVAGRARQVRIDDSRIAAYAATLPLEQAVHPRLDPHSHYLGRGEGTVAFLLTLNAINFGSGYFPHLKKRPGMSGYFTVASSLNDHYRAHGPLPAQRLEGIQTEDCAAVFGQDLANEPIRELMTLFSRALQDLGRYLIDRFDGRFVALVEAASASAERLVGLLVEMAYFDDVASYDGVDVPFYKRAQLTASDLALALDGREWGRFDDLDRLTLFADNLVPHVLRVDDILLYDGDLARRVDEGESIPAGSPEEIEIRACAVHSVELLAGALHRAGHDVTARGLDYLLWNRGQAPYYKRIRPRHRTRTVYY